MNAPEMTNNFEMLLNKTENLMLQRKFADAFEVVERATTIISEMNPENTDVTNNLLKKFNQIKFRLIKEMARTL